MDDAECRVFFGMIVRYSSRHKMIIRIEPAKDSARMLAVCKLRNEYDVVCEALFCSSLMMTWR